MLFKELKVGDIIYVKNPKQWNKPIKKPIGNIVPDGIWIRFYTPEGEFIGDGIACRPLGNRSGILQILNLSNNTALIVKKTLLKILMMK